jgi:probable rRNA maturation factor
MARLNREIFGRRGPTNVIAFPLDVAQAPSPVGFQPGTTLPPTLLGEVVISVETTRRQATEFGWPWRELLDFFLIHGILHLLGYDHADPAAEARMTARTWELLGVLYPGRSWDLEPASLEPANPPCPPFDKGRNHGLSR